MIAWQITGADYLENQIKHDKQHYEREKIPQTVQPPLLSLYNKHDTKNGIFILFKMVFLIIYANMKIYI